ncbi:MAG: polysaccharide biosynthesis protein [Alphaproteobacteria bacterium]
MLRSLVNSLERGEANEGTGDGRSPTESLHRLALAATQWPRWGKQSLSVGIDFTIAAATSAMVVAVYQMLCNCFGGGLHPVLLVLACGLITTACLGAFRIYRNVVRHWSSSDLLPFCAGILAAALGNALALGFAFPGGAASLAFPLMAVALFGPLLAWRLMAMAILYRAPTARSLNRPRRRIAVYGAGSAAAQLITWLTREGRAEVVAAFDDNPDLHRRLLQGTPIFPPSEVGKVIEAAKLEQIVVAIPSASVEQRRRILNDLARHPIRVQSLPPLSEIVDGKTAAVDFREVTPEELLSREPVRPHLELIRREILGRRVMVTGAGGSIGSALCREILQHRPAVLVLFDVSEFALYSIERDLQQVKRRRGLKMEIVPILGSVLNAETLTRTMAEHGVDIVYHAAAYKHVPLVEANPLRGVENNVFGTLNVAKAAIKNNVRKFVLVSTDKAVRPTNVMGASKRMAEKVVEGLSSRAIGTRFAIVRFGNVLDSAGSVVPLFRDQIREGGPVTVTDPEVVRYFMTIPEAAELVIQAGAMADGGVEVFHLDMGEPVRIADLALKMIHLSGCQVADDDHPEGIRIQYVGLRPGEKLFEELLVDGKALPT